MSDELKWHEAFEMLRADHGARAQIKTCDGAWTTVRMTSGTLEYEDHDGQWRTWSNVGSAMTPQWRRVPKAPSLHELVGAWRAAAAEVGSYTRRECASELEAALREGDYVSLKGVTAGDLYAAWLQPPLGKDPVGAFDAVLAYLRSRGAK